MKPFGIDSVAQGKVLQKEYDQIAAVYVSKYVNSAEPIQLQFSIRPILLID